METKIELTQEQIEALENLKSALKNISEVILNAWHVIQEACRKALEIFHAMFTKLARILFKVRLLKMKFPYWLANLIAEYSPWMWAWRWGFGWISQ